MESTGSVQPDLSIFKKLFNAMTRLLAILSMFRERDRYPAGMPAKAKLGWIAIFSMTLDLDG
jgi:hypothetical protein